LYGPGTRQGVGSVRERLVDYLAWWLACRDQAKQQGIKGDPMKDFMKSCMRG